MPVYFWISVFLSLTFFVCMHTEAFAVSCPEGWLASEESGTCLQMHDDFQLWSDARDACQAEGGDLVKIVNADMNDLIYEELLVSAAWIGLNDMDKDGVFVWLDEADEAEYIDLDPGCASSSHLCVYISIAFDGWCDMTCDGMYSSMSYICEVSPTVTTVEPTTLAMFTTTTKYDTITQASTLNSTQIPPDLSTGNGVTESTTGGLGTSAIIAVVVACVSIAVAVVVVISLFSYKRLQEKQSAGHDDDTVMFTNTAAAGQTSVSLKLS